MTNLYRVYFQMEGYTEVYADSPEEATQVVEEDPNAKQDIDEDDMPVVRYVRLKS
jgi:hypothetical protein